MEERSRQDLAKHLIVNADDFGRHVLIDRAVKLGVERGLIRSATVMVTGDAFADAVALARRTPSWDWASTLHWWTPGPCFLPARSPA